MRGIARPPGPSLAHGSAARTLTLALPLALSLAVGCSGAPREPADPHEWTEAQAVSIAKLSIDRLPPLPPDPSNAVADDPRAADLGQRLFFDTGLSGDGQVSCATCHKPDRYFEDGLALGEAIGTTKRHTPTLVGVSWGPWYYWDGRKDSQWSQALQPLETPVEHGGARTDLARDALARYRTEFETLFGPLPDLRDRARFPEGATPLGDEDAAAKWRAMRKEDRNAVNRVFASMGKALAAYGRTLRPGRARFDDYAAAVANGDRAAMAATFDDAEARGLRLFIGEANCLECHHGPRFTNDEFHNIGLPQPPNTKFDNGRIGGAEQVAADEFNCLSPWSDAPEDDCDELRFMKSRGLELMGAFKVPSLRNVSETAPYMHDGSMPTLGAVLLHYNEAPTPFTGHSDLVPLELDGERIAALEAFLGTLAAPVDAPPERLRDPAAP